MSRRVRSSNSGQIAPNFAVSSARLFTLQHSTDALPDATFIYLRYLRCSAAFAFTLSRWSFLSPIVLAHFLSHFDAGRSKSPCAARLGLIFFNYLYPTPSG